MLFSKPSHLRGDSIRNPRDIVTVTQTYSSNQRGLNEETKVHPMPGTHSKSRSDILWGAVSPTPDRASPHPVRALSYPYHGSAPSRQDSMPPSILQKPETSSDTQHRYTDPGPQSPGPRVSRAWWRTLLTVLLLSVRQLVMLIPTHTLFLASEQTLPYTSPGTQS